MNDTADYLAMLLVIGLAMAVGHLLDRCRRLRDERDVSRRYAATLEGNYNIALAQLAQRLVLHGHVADPSQVPQEKYTLLVTNGYTPEGVFVVLTIASTDARVLPRALAAVVVNAPPLPQLAR